jgi:hypothetical protein
VPKVPSDRRRSVMVLYFASSGDSA